jgi:AcrR family transcriptional regulator
MTAARATVPRPRPLDADAPEMELWRDLTPSSVQRLLLAALESFAQKGYHGTTTRDIAQRAAMSPAAIYMHYKSKEQLLYQISRATHEAMLREMREVFARPGTPPERLRALVCAHTRFHATMHTATRVANYELHALEPAHLEEMRVLRRGMESVMREALRLGAVSGDFEVADVDGTNRAVLSMGIDVSRWYSQRGRLSAEQLGDLHADMVLRMVGRPVAVPRAVRKPAAAGRLRASR